MSSARGAPPPGVTSYARSAKNIAGCIVALVGPLLVLTGVVGLFLGLALTPVLYAIGALAAPPRRRVAGEATLDRHDVRDVRRKLEKIHYRTMGRVTPEIRKKISAIATTINETLPRVATSGTSAHEQHVLVQCATDYLPTAIDSYLDLPRSYADHHVVADGKTPLVLLSDQLDVLERQVKEIAASVNRAGSDKLIANGRFLTEKFDRGPLDIGDEAAR